MSEHRPTKPADVAKGRELTRDPATAAATAEAIKAAGFPVPPELAADARRAEPAPEPVPENTSPAPAAGARKGG